MYGTRLCGMHKVLIAESSDENLVSTTLAFTDFRGTQDERLLTQRSIDRILACF